MEIQAKYIIITPIVLIWAIYFLISTLAPFTPFNVFQFAVLGTIAVIMSALIWFLPSQSWGRERS